MQAMKSKKIYLSALCGLLLWGCGDIAEDERYIPVEPVKVERTVLLEDFTGQNCVNCPAAHRTIEALEEQYGAHLVAVSIHAGHFGIPATNKRYTGLMQEEGQEYNDRYGIEEYPRGVVDGKTPTLGSDQWASAVYEDISAATPLSISLDAQLDDKGENILIDYSLKSSEALAGNLVVWIIESGIVARQEDINEGRINDYVHNNVFRACVNGLDGEAVTISKGVESQGSYSIAVKDTETEKWNVANLAVVAFVNNASGVLQAARTSLAKTEE